MLGQCIAFWIVPDILNSNRVKRMLTLNPSPTLYLLVAISIISVFLLHRPVLKFSRRYRNNYDLVQIPFTYVDILSIVIVSAFTTSVNNSTVALSFPVKLWLTAFMVAFFLWMIFVIYRSRFDDLSHRQNKVVLNPDFFPDEPITSLKEDFLGRSDFAREYYNRIAKYPSSDPFVFSLYGAWGEGKTSAFESC